MMGIINKIVDIWSECSAGVAILTIITTFALWFGVKCLQALLVMLLWNWTIIALFGLPALSFWTAFGLCFLCSLLFKDTITINTNSEN